MHSWVMYALSYLKGNPLDWFQTELNEALAGSNCQGFGNLRGFAGRVQWVWVWVGSNTLYIPVPPK
jgi:hypothetical protein